MCRKTHDTNYFNTLILVFSDSDLSQTDLRHFGGVYDYSKD